MATMNRVRFGATSPRATIEKFEFPPNAQTLGMPWVKIIPLVYVPELSAYAQNRPEREL